MPKWMTTPWESEVKGAWWKIIVALLVMMVAATTVSVVNGMLMESPEIARLIGTSMEVMSLMQFVALVTFLIVTKLYGIKFFNFGRVTRQGVLKTLGVYVAYMGVSSIVGLIVTYLMPEFNTTLNQEMLGRMFAGVDKWIVIVTVGVIVPIFEELLFRGVMMKYWFGKYPVVGAFLSWLLFTLAHLHAGGVWIEFVVYGMLSAVVVGIYWRTRRLEYAILFHMVNNLVVTFFMVL